MVAKSPKETVIARLIREGLFVNLDEAERHIRAGQVKVDGRTVGKPSDVVSPQSLLSVVASKQYVGRGALKLEHAISTFRLSPKGCICADVGSSTGGFTEVLLKHGAERVYAIDVGYGELDWKLRSDPRVVVMERTNARYVEALPEPISFVSVDVSFISLTKILPAVRKWIAPLSQIVTLVKPQFEAARGDVGEGGIVRDEGVHKEVLDRIVAFLPTIDLAFCGVEASPILGAEGNKEFLVWSRPSGG